jgi:nucleoid-associated protein YgaU
MKDNSSKKEPITTKVKKTTPQKSTTQKLKKEELALIVKLVLEEMRKEQQKNPIKVTKDTKPSEDSELLKSLQNTQVDTTNKPNKLQDKQIENEKMEKLANKKIKDKKDEIIKKKITYNAVVINKKEVKSVDDLARLYASINRISKKKKKKILKSAYTKKITKEIIIRKNAMRTITVRAGDTLSSIAQRAYGKSSMYKKIFEANPDLLSDPNSLRVGMKLRVPK